MRCMKLLTGFGLALFALFVSVQLAPALAGESSATGPPITTADLWSKCFVRGPYPTVYVSAVLRPPWTEEKPKAFAAFVAKKYRVTTYPASCLSAGSEAALEDPVNKQMQNYTTVPVVQTGWTYGGAKTP